MSQPTGFVTVKCSYQQISQDFFKIIQPYYLKFSCVACKFLKTVVIKCLQLIENFCPHSTIIKYFCVITENISWDMI